MSDITYPDPIVVDSETAHQASIIWLHGLGASANDFYSLMPHLDFEQKSTCRWIFPNAPMQAVTLNQGMVMPSWFDIASLDVKASSNIADIDRSADYITSLVQEEEARFQASDQMPRICLAGFSQGGLIALHAGMSWQQSPLHVLALSCCHPGISSLIDTQTEHVASHKVLMMHGMHDAVIPMSAGQQTYEELKKSGVDIEWKSYPMAHEVCPQQIMDISRFLATLTLKV